MSDKNMKGSSLLWIATTTSGLFFALEVVLLQGLLYATSYFYGQLVIALGLFGMLVGGFIATRISYERIETWLDRILVIIPLTPLISIGAVILSLAYTTVSIVLLIGVFVPFGFVLSLLYRRVSSWSLYSAELLGAVISLTGVVVLLPILREENVFLLLSVFAMIVVCVWMWRRLTPAKMALGCSILFFLTIVTVLNVQRGYLNFAVDIICDIEHEAEFGANKIMCGDERGYPYRVIRSLGSNVDRIDITQGAGDEYLGVNYSGTRNDLIQPYLPDVYIHDARIPGGIIEDPHVLIIGSGAEGVVKVAKGIGAKDITTVEYNPALIRLWNEDRAINEFSYAPFSDTTLALSEGRSFLAETDQVFDIITLMNTHRSINLRQFGQPDFLHTKEAFVSMLDRLSDRGFLSIEEPSVHTVADGEIASIIATVKEALKKRGSTDPSAHLIVYQWVGIQKDQPFLFEDTYDSIYTQILVKKTPWSEEEVSAFNAWAVTSHDTASFLKPSNMAFYRLLWSPQEGVNDAVAHSVIATAAQQTNTEIHIQSDERPFTTIRTSGDTMLLWVSIVLFTLTLVTSFSCWVCVVRGSSTALLWPWYFILIGLGFIGIEMFLLSWLQLYVGSIVWAFLLTIGGLFLSSALANALYWRYRILSRYTLFLNCVSVLVILLLFRHVEFVGLGMTIQSLIAGVVVLCVGVLLGPFFPYGIERVPSIYKKHVPLLVGLNGSALAVGVPISLVLASQFGFITLVLASVVLYVLATYLLTRYVT